MAASLQFDGKVILVTGAGSGIGRATSIALAKAGAYLALSDISKAGLAETLTLCHTDSPSPSHASRHTTTIFDVGCSAAATAWVKDSAAHFGKIDGVCNIAGVNPSFIDTATASDEYFDKLINTNLRGTFNVCRASIHHLAPGSAIVNLSSVAGLHPTSGFSIYCASKAGVIGFSKALALELGSKGVRVNVVAPGIIHTPTNALVMQGESVIEASAKGVSLGRVGRPEEVSEVVLWLLGDGARYVNGGVVEVDGGLFGSLDAMKGK
jgi:NAD(P)-dependent dehydrogenase (short-subunit alcohol dehydrogenase family)